MTGRPPRRLSRWGQLHPSSGLIELEVTPDEDAWLDKVMRTAAELGWQRRYHTHDSRRSTPGFPDLVLVHPGHHRVIFAELKSEKGKLTAEQAGWIADLRDCGLEVYVWRPVDLPQVDYVLARRIRP